MFPSARLIILALFASIRAIKAEGTVERKDFCVLNPGTLVCTRDNIEVPAERCGQVSEVSAKFQFSSQDEIVRNINDLRKNLAFGATSFEGVSFPRAGDMVQIEWNFLLEKAAQAYARMCTVQQAPREQRFVENLTEVGQFITTAYNTEKISETEIWPAVLAKWNNAELQNMQPYAVTNRAYSAKDFVMQLYGKTRFIGCGKIFFRENNGEKPYRYYVVCHTSSGDLSNSQFYVKNKPPCSACPQKTKCATNGTYTGVLCVWSGCSLLQATIGNLSLILISYLFCFSIFS